MGILVFFVWYGLWGPFSPAFETADPSREKVKFTQSWVWEYQNDWIAPGEPGNSGEFIVYHNSNTNSWLFDESAYGNTGQGFDFIIGNYNGQFIFGFKDSKGKRRKSVRSLSEVLTSRTDNDLVSEEFAEQYTATGKTRIFGKNIYGWPSFTGSEYTHENAISKETKVRYIADVATDFQPIVYFNYLEGDIKIPVHFPTDIPLGKVLLEDFTTYSDGKRIVIRLKEVSDTDYVIDLSKYR